LENGDFLIFNISPIGENSIQPKDFIIKKKEGKDNLDSFFGICSRKKNQSQNDMLC